ncbi:toll-like receptor Tollo [Teleopsis dalmanni]|uniref:toll-like receptor Tollo n=1 Tax=Teleopsis dalmanni TaxID=139649 RepID=UPI0018CFEC5B|nr:toll-like receptor Tollo [Teleopsis dalmanni]
MLQLVIKIPGLLLLTLIWSSSGAHGIKLNLTSSCAHKDACTFKQISVSYNDPLTVVNSSAPDLKVLVLRNSVIGRLPRELFDYTPNLSEFIMYKCNLNHLNALDFQNATKLKRLVLQNNRLSSLTEKVFMGVNSLEELYLAENAIHLIHRYAFKGLKELQYLDLQQNSIASLEFGLLVELENLVHLDLSYNEITEIDSKTFLTNVKLQTLLLNNNKITQFDTNLVAQFTHLHLLDISNINIEEIALNSVDTLIAQNCSLKSLHIRGSAMKINANRNNLKKIKIDDVTSVLELDLRGNLFETLDDFQAMTNLQKLDISKNQLINILTSSISIPYLTMPNLLHLNLAWNSLHEVQSAHFLLLQKLTYLDLAMNSLKNLDSLVLDPLVNLEKFYIEGNQLQTFDFDTFVKDHENVKEIGLFNNEWEFNYIGKVINSLQEHSIHLPLRTISSNNSKSLHINAAHTNTQARFSSSASSMDKLTKMSHGGRPHDGNEVTSIHPYWTTIDIMAMIILVIVFLILLTQFYLILKEEDCFISCRERWRRITYTQARSRRLNEEDSQV